MADHSRCGVNCGATDCPAPNWDKTLRSAARRSAKVIRQEPDCRTCVHTSTTAKVCYLILHSAKHCTNGDRHEPLPPVKLWRTA